MKSKLVLLLTAILFSATAFAQEPYALGADISWIPQRESENVKYAHNGQVKDAVVIFKEQGFSRLKARVETHASCGGLRPDRLARVSCALLDEVSEVRARHGDRLHIPLHTLRPYEPRGGPADSTRLRRRVRPFMRARFLRFLRLYRGRVLGNCGRFLQPRPV